MDPWVELRIHGVSGTPPEDLLDRPLVVQVDGDARSRFFRATGADHEILAGTDDQVVEGFHWGRYTSGSWIQALWLTLLPVGLVNLAAFMLPGPRLLSTGDEEPRAVRARSVALGFLRLLGVLLTMLLSLAVSMTLIDVVAVRWLGTQDWAPEWAVSFAPLAATLAAGAFIAVLGGRAWFVALGGARRTTDPPLRATPPVTSRSGDVAGAASRGAPFSPFASEEFYTGDPDTLTLRGLHVAAGFAVPAFLATSVAGNEVARLVALAVVGVVLLVVGFLGDKEGAATTAMGTVRSATRWHTVATWLTRVVVVTGAGLLVVAAFAIQGIRPTDGTEDTTLTRGPEWSAEKFDEAASYLLVISGVCLFGLTVAVVVLAFLSRPQSGSPGTPWWHFRPYSHRCAAVPVAALGLFLGVGYSAALVLGVSTLLARTDSGEEGATITTEVLKGVAYAFGIGVIPVLGIGLLLGVQRFRSRKELAQRARRGLPDPSPFPEPRLKAWRRALASAIWVAQLKNAVQAIIWTIVVAASVLTLAMALHQFDLLDIPLLAYRTSGMPAWDAAWWKVGTWLLLGMIGGMVALSRGALRSTNLRRGVNIIWDVIAFWPHAVHPFIPEPYSLRVVRDLAQRIRDHLALLGPTDTSRQVVVCGHSQGSLIGFAALNLLTDEECRRVSFLTFGSQLRVIFPRAFPLYVNYAGIDYLYKRLDRSWINLYRETDPLAGPVLSWNHTPDGQAQSFPDTGAAPHAPGPRDPYGTVRHGADWLLLDPVPRVDRLQQAPVQMLHKHSHFWASPEWMNALRELRSIPPT
ncbi:MAG: hypothetical protein ABWY19_08590 [Marmoricola sp.]